MQAVGQHVGVPEALMARRDPFSELMQGSARGMPFPMAAAGAGSAGPVLGNGRLDSEDLQLPDGINVEEARWFSQSLPPLLKKAWHVHF